MVVFTRVRLVDLLSEVEFKTKKLLDEKTNDFHAAYAAMDRKLRDVEQQVIEANFYWVFKFRIFGG